MILRRRFNEIMDLNVNLRFTSYGARELSFVEAPFDPPVLQILDLAIACHSTHNVPHSPTVFEFFSDEKIFTLLSAHTIRSAVFVESLSVISFLCRTPQICPNRCYTSSNPSGIVDIEHNLSRYIFKV